MRKIPSKTARKVKSKVPETDAVLIGRITSMIRRVWLYSKVRTSELQKASTGKDKYLCSKCLRIFNKKEIHVDHIDPFVPEGCHIKDMTLSEIVKRMFRTETQVLCVECHAKKTKEETASRKIANKKNKE